TTHPIRARPHLAPGPSGGRRESVHGGSAPTTCRRRPPKAPARAAASQRGSFPLRHRPHGGLLVPSPVPPAGAGGDWFPGKPLAPRGSLADLVRRVAPRPSREHG